MEAVVAGRQRLRAAWVEEAVGRWSLRGALEVAVEVRKRRSEVAVEGLEVVRRSLKEVEARACLLKAVEAVVQEDLLSLAVVGAAECLQAQRRERCFLAEAEEAGRRTTLVVEVEVLQRRCSSQVAAEVQKAVSSLRMEAGQQISSAALKATQQANLPKASLADEAEVADQLLRRWLPCSSPVLVAAHCYCARACQRLRSEVVRRILALEEREL